VRLELPEVERRARAVLAARPGVRFGLLFGSAVTKGTERARDLDVAVGFVGSPSLMELARLSDDLEAAVGMPVDVVDVETATTLLRWEIVRTGRMIHGRAEAAALEFLARVPVEWSDVQPYREREVAGLRRRLEEGRWSDPTS
jgi:predicted nucleotidyltransferase